jgi:hypothetical protein
MRIRSISNRRNVHIVLGMYVFAVQFRAEVASSGRKRAFIQVRLRRLAPCSGSAQWNETPLSDRLPYADGRDPPSCHYSAALTILPDAVSFG